MARGDITAGEVFEDREMLNRLGYGIFDLAWGTSGVGFENVRDFTYVIGQDKDPKIYRLKVYELLGRYYDNTLAKALWNKIIEHKWVLSERAEKEIDLKTAAVDWFQNYGHPFLKDWTFRRAQVPNRIRNKAEARVSALGSMAGYLVPNLRELLENGFTVTDIIKAALTTRPLRIKMARPQGHHRRIRFVPAFPFRRAQSKPPFEEHGSPEDSAWRDETTYLVVNKIGQQEKGRFYVHLVAKLTGHAIRTPEEAEKRWQEILEHKWYMSEREGQDVGIRTAALDYYRRLNLIQEAETGQES